MISERNRYEPYLGVLKIKKKLFASLFIVWLLSFSIYYLLAPRFYTSSMEIIPSDSSQSASNQLVSLGLNIPLNSSNNFNSAVLYPDIVKSNRLIKKLINSSIDFYGEELLLKEIFLKKYFNKSLKKNLPEDNLNLLLIDYFKKNVINVSRNRMTDITTIDITTFDKNLSKELSLLLFDKFNEIQLQHRNNNLDSQMRYTSKRISEVALNLDKLQKNKIEFLNSNSSIKSPQLLYELELLETNINMEKAVFLSLRNQYELYEMDKSNLTNLASFIDVPLEPLKHSKPSFRTNFAISFILLIIIFLSIAFKDFFKGKNNFLSL